MDLGPGPSNYSLSMGWVCHEPLLDSRHWHAEVPDFSVCLQKTILIWVPCGFLWLCAPFLIYIRLKSRHVQIQHTLLNIVATILAVGLVVFALADLIYFANDGQASLVDIIDPILRGVTWVLVTVLIQLNRMRGCRNSSVLWIFWTLFVLLSVPRIYSQMLRETAPDMEGDLTETLSYIMTFVIIFTQWILAFFMDKRPMYASGEGNYYHDYKILNFDVSTQTQELNLEFTGSLLPFFLSVSKDLEKHSSNF